jgi:hypothetical protein
MKKDIRVNFIARQIMKDVRHKRNIYLSSYLNKRIKIKKVLDWETPEKHGRRV